MRGALHQSRGDAGMECSVPSRGSVDGVDNDLRFSVLEQVPLSPSTHCREEVLIFGVACQHDDVGGWAKGRPIARGKGVNFNELLPADHRHIDPICGAFEICVKLKAYKVDSTK